MTTISEAVNNEIFPSWNEYSAAEEAVNKRNAIEAVWFLSNLSIIRNVYYLSRLTLPGIAYISVIASIVGSVAALFKRFERDDYNGLRLRNYVLVSFFNLASSLAHPSFYFTGLPLFSIMCIYSLYLQTKGLTPQRYLELGVAQLLEIIRTGINKSCNLLEKVVERNTFTYIYVNSMDMTPANFLTILDEAYRNKKIICFSSLVSPPPKHNYYYYVGDSIQTYSITYDTDEVLQEMEDRLNRQGYHEKVMDAFQISVNYLIQCKEADRTLDEQLINEQLKHLTAIWGTSFDDYKLKLAPNLQIENGVPIILISSMDELRSALPLKLKISKYFDNIIERRL